MEKLKGKFFVFKTIDKDGRTMYLQHLVSPSIGGRALSMTSFPEFGWRGQTKLDIAKVRALIAVQSCGIRDADWTLEQYEMEMDTPSWARQPEKKEYKNLLPELFASGFTLDLNEKEEKELSIYKKSLEDE